MSVKIYVHVTHRQHTNGEKTVDVEGSTVGEALNELISLYPSLKPELFKDSGDLRNHIEIYLNDESAFPGELEKKVTDGDEIQVLAFLSGG